MLSCAWPMREKCLTIARCLQPLLLLLIRCWMARVFFLSGLTKIRNWDSTVSLFESEYHVPLLPPAFAAFSATMIELACPVLLVLGLATRLATLPMLCMVAVIQFTYLSHTDHLYWSLLLTTILLFGPGLLSLDHWLVDHLCRRAGKGGADGNDQKSGD